MRKLTFFIVSYVLVTVSFAQTINQKLVKAFQQFERDAQLKHAIISLYIIDAVTGTVIFDKNSQTGLAPASTQKIVTAISAFELLGKDYRYKTEFSIVANGNKTSLVIMPSGDPTFGSWRWSNTGEEKTIGRIIEAIKNTGASLSWPVIISAAGWNSETIPDGWIWQDIGNYYGAGSAILNWRENQFDIKLESGKKIGDPVKITAIIPASKQYRLSSQVKSAAKGSGDNAYVYYSLKEDEPVIRGSIPVNEKDFLISAASPAAASAFTELLTDSLRKMMIISGPTQSLAISYDPAAKGKIIHTELSPPLDSIMYWFLRKSINLYGEALLKTMAFRKTGVAATDTGVQVLKDFWRQQGIDPAELNIYDGSGLSPMNRITTHAQVEILRFAKKRPWFPSFFDALPVYNNMKLKSGTIGDAKTFCGYHKSGSGTEYIVSFFVNNYTGSAATIVDKMYRILNVLK